MKYSMMAVSAAVLAVWVGYEATFPAVAAPPVGTVFRDCEECPLMVVVPAGSFLMGSPEAVRGVRTRPYYQEFTPPFEGGMYIIPEWPGWDENEGPAHRVEVARPFAVGVYEVTFAEWDACVSGGGCGGYRPADGGPREGGWGRGSRPVINVRWLDTQSYVRWLKEKTGREYRLPSESEWEYAARAGTDTDYHWGDEIGSNRANCRSCGSRWDLAQTAPVGSFRANAFGLHDMHGNVWEWVEDCSNERYEGAPSDGSAWESGDCRYRMQRGGDWASIPADLRSAARSWGHIKLKKHYIGFRVARTLAP